MTSKEHIELFKKGITSSAKLGDYLHLPLNSERLQKFTENYVIRNMRMVNANGKSLSVPAEEGIIGT